MNKDVAEMAKELLNILGNVEGVEGVTETLSLSYTAVVQSDEAKSNVEKVAQALAPQAEKFGFELDIMAVTQAEVDEARQKYAEHLASTATFKA